jgi:hypothetical protein
MFPLIPTMRPLLPLLLMLPVAFASPVKRASTPTVTIAFPQGTIIGSTGTSVESFNGIPFAQPPTGALRLKPPQPLTAPLGTVTATGTAQACPQFFFSDATSSKLYFHGNLLFSSTGAGNPGAVLGAVMISLSLCLGSLVPRLLSSLLQFRNYTY